MIDTNEILVHSTTELARILENGEPTFTGEQVRDRSHQVEEEGRQRSEDLREMDVRMEALYKTLQLLVRRRAHAARQVGALRDTKVRLSDLQKIAFARLR